MKAFTKLRDKLFPKSDVGISAIFSEGENSIEPGTPSVSENSLPAVPEVEPEPERLELTPELREALFPKTRTMISATFKPSKSEETPREAPRENCGSKIEGEQDFPIV